MRLFNGAVVLVLVTVSVSRADSNDLVLGRYGQVEVHQTGMSNQVAVSQTSSGNTANVVQNGSRNRSLIRQEGGNGSTTQQQESDDRDAITMRSNKPAGEIIILQAPHP